MSDDPRAIVFLGKTGSGKSTLGNIITDGDTFAVGRGGRSVTKQCRSNTATFRRRQWTVVDTPGTRDVNDKDGMLNELPAAIKHCTEGIDAFLVVVRCDVRMTDDECKAIEEAVGEFGPECFKRTIMIFSHGDVFNNDKDEFANELVEMRKEIPKLNEMMNRFGNRWLLMDNGKRCDSEVRERQLSDLEALVDSVARLNSKRYSESDLKSDEKKLKKKNEHLKNKIAFDRKLHKMELKRLEDKHEAEKKRMEDKLQAQDQRTKDLIQAEKQRTKDLLQAQGQRANDLLQAEKQRAKDLLRAEQRERETREREMCLAANQMRMQIEFDYRNQQKKDDGPSFTGFLSAIGEGTAQVALSPFVGMFNAITSKSPTVHTSVEYT